MLDRSTAGTSKTLALYWATQRQFWSMLERLENSIKEYDHNRDDPDVATAVQWATIDTITAEARPEVLNQYARRRVESLDDLEQSVEDALSDIATPNFESRLLNRWFSPLLRVSKTIVRCSSATLRTTFSSLVRGTQQMHRSLARRACSLACS
jgi:hypothetical protein